MGLIVIFIFVPVLVAILLILNPLLSPKKTYNDKLSAYECGFTPILGQERGPITIGYYLVGILYLVFDLEVALLVPLAIGLSSISIPGYFAVMVLIAILTAGLCFRNRIWCIIMN